MVETADTRRLEGRGQGNPGPSRFAARPLGGAGLTIALVVLSGAIARFLFGTVLSDSSGAHGAAVATGLVTGVALLAQGIGGRGGLSVLARFGALIAGGALSVLSPVILQLNQHSDAPAGSVVAFWTVLIPAMLLLVLGARGGWRTRLWSLAIALIAVTGGAGVLANWERPSSFTLLNRYVAEQLALGGASFLWVASVLALTWIARGSSSRPMLLWAGIGAIGASAGALAVSGGSTIVELGDPVVWLYAAGFSAVSLATVWWLGRGDASAPFTGLALVPTALTFMVFVESATGTLGPEPILRVPVMWGSLTALAAAALAMQRAGRGIGASPADAGARPATSFALGVAACAAIGMLTPALDVEVQGRLADFSRFAAQFEMRGFESVGGWLAVGIALLALAVAGSNLQRRVAAASLVLGMLVAATWYFVGATPLHTWVSWIPPDVQQDYGTEFATISFTPLARTWQLAAVLLSVLSLAWSAFARRIADPSVRLEERDVS